MILTEIDRKNYWHLFIFQIAHHCYKDTQNYNSMFAITCGLNHSAVMRLKNSRQRLPPKYTKLLEELTQVIVPDRNFSRYRNLISNASVSHMLCIISLFILWSFRVQIWCLWAKLRLCWGFEVYFSFQFLLLSNFAQQVLKDLEQWGNFQGKY